MQAEQLRPLDAAYLALDGPRTVGHVCLMLPLDGAVTFSELLAQVRARVGRLPELRRRLRQLPFGVDRPWWVDDTEFDVRHHVFEDRAGPAGMAAAVARIAMGPLDRSRPLWEAHLVIATDGSCAVVTKVHHAIADGSRMRDILHALLGIGDEVGQDRDADPLAWDPEPEPSLPALLTRGALGLMSWSVEAGVSAVLGAYASAICLATTQAAAKYNLPHVVDVGVADQSVTDPSGLARAVDFSGWPGAPATILNKPVSGRRSWAFGTWDLQASKPARAKLAATVNDLLHAAAAAGLRSWLLERDALPTAPLVAMVPISVRHLAVDQSGANRIALTLCTLPTDVADPAERVVAARESMAAAKSHPAMSEEALAVVFRAFAPVLSPGSTLATALRLPDYVHLPFNTVISNVPMGADLFGVGARRVTAVYPFPPIGEGMGVNVTVQGYRGRLDVGVSACAEIVPDIEDLFAAMTREWETLCAL